MRLSAVLLVILTVPAFSQPASPIIYPDDPIEFTRQFWTPTFPTDGVHKAPGHYTITDWDQAIDNTWGWGLPKAEKLQIFDTFWDTVDQQFACFNGIDDNWDELRHTYRAEIENGDPVYGVSRGRMAGIINHLCISLRESHTSAVDMDVNWNTALDPGVPLMVVGCWGYSGHFGAGLTLLPDNTLLVYTTVANHPLGLEPGDIVLGYDGIPWSQIYQELLDAQLPTTGWWWGCSPEAFEHSMMISAGQNWHLFDTIDIIKYSTGETLHLATDPMIGQNLYIWCTEQLQIPGVPVPDYFGGQRASYGIIDGTQIGYIYVMGWSGNVQQEFYDAIHSLMYDYETTGLIIDFRTNYGGNMFLSNPGLSLLFGEDVETVDFAVRCNSNDHLSMCSLNSPGSYIIPGDPSSFYDKPIAVLVGPGAVSSGDQVALRFKFHPMARLFGKTTATAFNSPVNGDLGNSSWSFRFAKYDAFLLTDPNTYLTHQPFTVDEEVWLTPDDVAEGEDTVVKAAIDWINNICGDYVIGDFDGNGAFNIVDITDGFSKLKTGSPQPALNCVCPLGGGQPWPVAMDVNSSCGFNIADITTGFSKLKTGSPDLIPCQECPPLGWQPRR